MLWDGTALELILGKGTAADSGAPLRSNITHRRLDSRSMGEFGITIDKWDDPPGNFVFLVGFPWFSRIAFHHSCQFHIYFTSQLCFQGSRTPEPLLIATSQSGLRLSLPRTLVARVGFMIPISLQPIAETNVK